MSERHPDYLQSLKYAEDLRELRGQLRDTERERDEARAEMARLKQEIADLREQLDELTANDPLGFPAPAARPERIDSKGMNQ